MGLLGFLLLVACSGAPPEANEAQPGHLDRETGQQGAELEFGQAIPAYEPPNQRVEDDEVYDLGSSLPPDAIRPVYNPEFASAQDAPLDEQELIIGVAWGGEAKAYPITVLRFREMVNDELAGVPTLVTW